MEVGKVPNSTLQKIILDKLKQNREEVLMRPKIGEDCAAIDFGSHVCVLSTDPITGAVNDVGRLAVHVSCNDIASCGVEPLGLLLTILAPPGTTEKDLETVMTDVCQTADSLNIDILGGHTEITTAVNRIVISCTAIGKGLKSKMISTSGAQPGDFIVMTKSAGLEGTAILAKEKESELLSHLDIQTVERAKHFVHTVSVVKEGIIAGKHGATAMHDVTEGGILGALWEISEASDAGIRIYRDLIPVEAETAAICGYFGIDPLKLISSGSMIITCKDGDVLTRNMKKQGIRATVIGMVTEEKEKVLVYSTHTEELSQPQSDELYKVINTTFPL